MDACGLTIDGFPAYCRERGLKCTAQRMAVFAAIGGKRAHPAVDEVWRKVRKRLPTVTRESVYRILNGFSAIGLVSRMDSLNAARYDTMVGPHAHFICEICGRVDDYPLPGGLPVPEGVRGEQRHLELRISGICEKCLKKQKGKQNGT
ncbi:MAG: Fur family transcriptional regulator [Kiritimatiellia bacterium]